MHLDILDPAVRQLSNANVDLFPNIRFGRRTFLNNPRLNGEIQVGGILSQRVHPAISDQKPFEWSLNSRRLQNRGGDVRDVLTGVRFACDVGLV